MLLFFLFFLDAESTVNPSTVEFPTSTCSTRSK